MTNTRPVNHTTWTITLLLILLVAAGLRLYRLPNLPLGLHYDEAANGILAGEIAQGAKTPVFISSYTGKEVLFFYWTALWMKLLGMTPLALRLGAATAGVATVAATIWAVCELLHGQHDAKWTALLTGAFVAASFWHLVLSRYGFRAVTQPLMQALTVAALWRGLRLSNGRQKGFLWLILAGLFCGLTAYTYLAARAFPVPLAAALLTLLVTDKDRRRARLGQLAIFVTAAALALAPLAHYWLTHPGSFMTRATQVAATNRAQVWTGIRACLGMLFLQGDPYIRFNIPHRPLFDPITAVLFLLGIITTIWTLKRPRYRTSYIFILIYIPTMLLPSALAVGDITPSNLRTVGLLPFIYIFPALGLSTIKSAISKSFSRYPVRPLRSAFIILLLAIATPTTAIAYFRDWASSSALYYAADGDLADVAAYLNQADLITTTPYVASIHYRHPTLAFLAEDYGAIRWLRGGETVVFPAKGDGLLVFSHSTSGELTWAQSVLPDTDRTPAAAPPGPDGVPAFHAYRVSSNPDLEPTHPLTANLAHVVHLIGYDVIGQPQSNEIAEVAVWWRVMNSPNTGDYGPVARLTDPWGFVWGETQPFHYPSEQWMPGEWVVDHLAIPVAPGTPPGDYTVRLSFYSGSTDSLLSVLDADSHYAGNNIQLPVQLTRATTPPAPDRLPIRKQLDAHSDDLILLGANLDTTNARPGERIYLALFWQNTAPALPNMDITLTLDDVSLYVGSPVHGTYPTSEWTIGEIVMDRYDLRLPRDTSPGNHEIQLYLNDLTLDLGTIAVPAINRAFDVPPISHPLTATLDGQVELLGYDISAETVTPGDTLVLTLYWQALTEMDENYTVFTHLIAPDGSTTGQRDSHPINGTYPTSLWMTGEIVADIYEIPTRADAVPGTHRLEVGMYIAETGDRLPTDIPDDAIVLQAVTLQ
ncbi:MAG: phospholipid carrier-dependent glycosyltransferase [Chloroflexi bacterium]|nr:phospholipid carrier-dependent glycosyltransferase [Chloroflexota bacterium]